MKKTALITGATSGIGNATAYEFAKHGINLILCGRRQERLNTIQKALEQLTNVHILNFDVSDKSAVENAINSLPNDFKKIDVLINNAGIYRNQRMLSHDGFELTLAVNHLAYYLLTGLVLDLLHAAPGAMVRITCRSCNLFCMSARVAPTNSTTSCAL